MESTNNVSEDVSASDVRTVIYFIQEKGDINRWTEWDKKKKAIAAKYPHLIEAIERVSVAERTLAAVLKDIEQDSYDD